MNQDQRNALGVKIGEAAFYYGKTDLSKEQVISYINVIIKYYADQGLEKIISAIDSYILDSKNKFLFSPATLRPYLFPELSTETKSIEVASRLTSAVRKFGYSNPGEARAYVGELGWKIVERNGGWQPLCENLGVSIPVTTFQAQARETAKALIETAGLGEFDKPIGIEFKEQKHPNMILNDKKREEALKFLDHLKTQNEMPK
jgi:hypothetical protein